MNKKQIPKYSPKIRECAVRMVMEHGAVRIRRERKSRRLQWFRASRERSVLLSFRSEGLIRFSQRTEQLQIVT